jgi:hypothetical protein
MEVGASRILHGERTHCVRCVVHGFGWLQGTRIVRLGRGAWFGNRCHFRISISTTMRAVYAAIAPNMNLRSVAR